MWLVLVYQKINMKNANIYFFIGTTAELIKLAPVIREFKKRKTSIKIIASGQSVLHLNELKPLLGNISIYYQLRVKPIRLPGFYFRFVIWTIKCFFNFLLYFKNEFNNLDKKRILFIIQGDTVSSLLGAIIAKIYGLKLVHIESGLRSNNFFEPFPEELCRFIISQLVDIHFCPNLWSINNLKKTGGLKINTYNNTLIETFHEIIKIKENQKIIRKKFFLLILHRQEHVLYKKKSAIKFLRLLTEYSANNLVCVLIMHKITEKFLRDQGLMREIEKNKNIIFVPRLPYHKFITLVKNSEFIATDGGSNQEESFYLGKPCLILRNVTERIEGLGKNAVLSQGDEKKIRHFIKNYKTYKRACVKISIPPSKIIVDYLIKH